MSFATSCVVLLEIDPRRLLVYWEVDPEAIRAERRRLCDGDAVETVRIHEVTLVDFDGTNSHEFYDFDVRSSQGNYYAVLPGPAKTLLGEFGVRGKSGKFAAILRSNTLQLPPERESARFEDRRGRIAGAGSALWLPRRVTRAQGTEATASAPAAPSLAPRPELVPQWSGGEPEAPDLPAAPWLEETPIGVSGAQAHEALVEAATPSPPGSDAPEPPALPALAHRIDERASPPSSWSVPPSGISSQSSP